MQFRVKYPKDAAGKLRGFFNLVLFGLLCTGVGSMCTLFVLMHLQTQEVKLKSRQMESDLNSCAEVVREYIKDRKVILQQFKDMEARFTRMEHLMAIPRSERHGAWREMEEEWIAEGDVP